MTATDKQQIRPGHRVLVTGASGFVGRTLCDLLLRAGYRVSGSSRAPASPAAGSGALEWAQVGALSAQTDWSQALQDVDAVVHLAARVHQPGERTARTEALHHRSNYEGTVRLAEMSASAGVRRLVFLSTVKVNGKRTVRHADGSWQRYSEDDVPHPQGAYAQSKWEAEQALLEIAARGPMAVTILRPPLVYGPGVGANFLRLVRAVQKGVPLPFARVVNLRSLVYVENLAEAILVCMESQAAAHKTYLISDVDVSTPDLIYAIASVLGRRPRLIRMPLWALRLGGVLTLRSAAVSRLLDSLLIDDSRIRRELFWTPSMTMQQGLARTAAWLGVKAPEPGYRARRAPGAARS
ncbi:MAG: NAD-dependent epimerase/dehydratase family protein [Chromatiales bacterium]